MSRKMVLQREWISKFRNGSTSHSYSFEPTITGAGIATPHRETARPAGESDAERPSRFGEPFAPRISRALARLWPSRLFGQTDRPLYSTLARTGGDVTSRRSIPPA